MTTSLQHRLNDFLNRAEMLKPSNATNPNFREAIKLCESAIEHLEGDEPEPAANELAAAMKLLESLSVPAAWGKLSQRYASALNRHGVRFNPAMFGGFDLMAKYREYLAERIPTLPPESEAASAPPRTKHNRHWIDDSSNLWRVCVHEACHAVTLATMNQLPSTVVVDACDSGNVRGGSMRLVDSLHGESKLACLLAGGIGEELATNSAARWTNSDERQIDGTLRTMGWSKTDTRLDALRRIVDERLRRNQRAVNVVAAELYRRAPQAVSRDEILSLLNESGVAL